MQILYAAPFLLLAAILFSVLAAIPSTRRFAIIAPTGAIVFGPASLIGYFVVLLVRSKIWGHDFPADRWDGAAYVMSGLIAAGIVILILRIVLRFLPALMFQLVVFAGAFCSYFVLFCAANFGSQFYLHWNAGIHYSIAVGVLILGISLLLCACGAWLTSRYSSQFRTQRQSSIR